MSGSSDHRDADLTDDTVHWVTRSDLASSHWTKQAIYAVARPVMTMRDRRELSPAMRSHPALRWVIRDRGLPLETRRRRVRKHATGALGRVLVAGTGSGWDLPSWTIAKPRTLIGSDLYSFAASWNAIASAGASRPSTIAFTQAALEALPFPNGAFDAVVSDAVYEHCTDLEAVLLEAARVTRPGGLLYASYGPMWFTFGGDHFSGVDTLSHGYAHLEMDADAYASYVDTHRASSPDAQDGVRYIALDLFSKLRPGDYLALVDRAGFDVREITVQISPRALAFREAFPDRFRAIADTHGCDQADLIVEAHILVATRRSAPDAPAA